MPLQNFIDKFSTVYAAWLNQVDTLFFTVFNQAATKPAARTALTSDAPLEVVNGGTGARDPATARVNLTVDNPLEIVNGGTGARNVTAAQNNLFTGSDLTIANGGTGASTAPAAVTNLGFNPITLAEQNAGVASVNTYYPVGNVLRYGADPTGVTSSRAAFNLAYNSAMAATPHGAVYAPAGLYLIDNPGLNWTNQSSIRLYGDGKNSTVLTGDSTNHYTILTVSADIGVGTSGNNVTLSDFAIQSAATTQPTLSLSDYQYCTLDNLTLLSSASALTMKGMAVTYARNLQCLVGWINNAPGSSALLLTADTHGNGCGPVTFVSCQFNGQGDNLTTGAAIYSNGTVNGTFINCVIEGKGAGMVSLAEFINRDDVTFIECYSEASQNTTSNNAVLFNLVGSTSPVQGFVLLGGTYFTGDGVHSCNYLINGLIFNKLACYNITAAGFATAMINTVPANFTGLTLIALNNMYSSGAGNPPVFSSAFGPVAALMASFRYPSVSTGWGTPTGPGVIANYAGASATLVQTSTALAKLITDLKTAGVLGA